MEYGTLVSDGLGFCTQAMVNLLLGGQATFDIGGKTTTRHNVYRSPASSGGSSSAVPSPSPPVPKKPAIVRQVEEIITRTKDPNTGETQYECLCQHGEDPFDLYFPQPIPPLSPPSQKWRCATCTRQHPRVWSAVNPSSSPNCKECHRHFTETGWCFLLSYSELSSSSQQEADMIYGPPSPTSSRSAPPPPSPSSSQPPPSTALRQSDIGFLASSEVVGAHLRKPRFPVWILYSGSHYTLVFGIDPSLLVDPTPPSPVRSEMWHFNGLPPGGPLLRSFEMTIGGAEKSEDDGGNGSGQLMQVSEVVTRSKNGRFYEVVCEQTDFLKKNHPAFSRPQNDEKWRCLRCTHQQPRVWRAVNETGDGRCKECGGGKEEVGWCPWLLYEELPLPVRKEVDDRYCEAITQILRTRWKEAACRFREGDSPPCL